MVTISWAILISSWHVCYTLCEKISLTETMRSNSILKVSITVVKTDNQNNCIFSVALSIQILQLKFSGWF